MTPAKPLTFALDFDDTFTACPELWAMFINQAKSLGHTVYIVTARRGTTENADIIRDAMFDACCEVSVVFSSLGSKIHAMERRGIKVDIWIDDDPEKLVKGH